MSPTLRIGRESQSRFLTMLLVFVNLRDIEWCKTSDRIRCNLGLAWSRRRMLSGHRLNHLGWVFYFHQASSLGFLDWRMVELQWQRVIRTCMSGSSSICKRHGQIWSLPRNFREIWGRDTGSEAWKQTSDEVEVVFHPGTCPLSLVALWFDRSRSIKDIESISKFSCCFGLILFQYRTIHWHSSYQEGHCREVLQKERIMVSGL